MCEFVEGLGPCVSIHPYLHILSTRTTVERGFVATHHFRAPLLLHFVGHVNGVAELIIGVWDYVCW